MYSQSCRRQYNINYISMHKYPFLMSNILNYHHSYIHKIISGSLPSQITLVHSHSSAQRREEEHMLLLLYPPFHPLGPKAFPITAFVTCDIMASHTNIPIYANGRPHVSWTNKIPLLQVSRGFLLDVAVLVLHHFLECLSQWKDKGGVMLLDEGPESFHSLQRATNPPQEIQQSLIQLGLSDFHSSKQTTFKRVKLSNSNFKHLFRV